MSETPKEVFLARWLGGVGQIPIVFRLAWGLCVFVCVCVCGWLWATEIEREALDRGEVVFWGLRLAGWPLHNSSMEDRTSCLLQRLNSDTHTHTHLYDPEWHISPDRWHHTLPWLVGTSPFNLNIQLLRNLSLSLSLTPYGQSQGALFWDRWPMATTLTQSRVKPRNKTGRLVWFGPIRAFRVRRKCKEENERGYGLGKVKKNISHWTSPRQVIYVQFCTTAFHLYTKLNVHILWLWINVFCNFKHYFFFKKDLTVLKNEAQCCPLSQQTFRPCSDPQKFSSKSSSDKLYSISKQKSS